MWVQGILPMEPYQRGADPRHYKGTSKYVRQIFLIISDEEPSPGSGHSTILAPAGSTCLPEET